MGEVISFPTQRAEADLYVRVTKNRRRWEVWFWETFPNGAANGKNLAGWTSFCDSANREIERDARRWAKNYANQHGIKVKEE